MCAVSKILEMADQAGDVCGLALSDTAYLLPRISMCFILCLQ